MLASVELWLRKSPDACRYLCSEMQALCHATCNKGGCELGELFFSERGKVCYHVTGFLEVKAIGSALQIHPESW